MIYILLIAMADLSLIDEQLFNKNSYEEQTF